MEQFDPVLKGQGAIGGGPLIFGISPYIWKPMTLCWMMAVIHCLELAQDRL